MTGDTFAPRIWLSDFLDDVGDGSGQTQMTGNYSSTPVEFRKVPALDQDMEIHSATIEISSTAISRFGYGNGIGLTNGIEFYVAERQVVSGPYVNILNFLSSFQTAKVIFHHDWSRAGAENVEDVARILANPAAVPTMYFHFDMVALFGSPIVLRGSRGSKIVVRVNDDFSVLGMTKHRTLVRGFQYASRFSLTQS